MPYADNDYPNPDNFPVVSFRSPIPAPLVDPTVPEFLYVAFNVYWAEVLGAAVMALQQPSTWAGDHDDVILAQNRANTLAVLLQTPAEVAPGQSPFWDDENGDDADGSSSDNSYTWSEKIEDWAIAAFVASSGVPGAAVAYLTIAPKFRLLFRQRDYGGIVKIFLDGGEIGEVDTYGAVPATVGFDVVVPAAFARLADPDPHEIKLLITGEHNAAAIPNAAGQYPVDIIRKRLDPEELVVSSMVRQNPVTPCILEQSFDGGDTWEQFADLLACPPILETGVGGSINQGYHVGGDVEFFRVPDGAWVSNPPDVWFDNLQANGVMLTQNNDQCTAAANAANVLFKLAQGIGQSLINQLVGGDILEPTSLLDYMVNLLFGVTDGAATLGLLAAFLIEQARFSSLDFTNASDFRKVTCLINNNMTGTAGNWAMNYSAILGGLAGAGLTAGIADALTFELSVVGANGLLLAAKTTAIADYNCAAVAESTLWVTLKNQYNSGLNSTQDTSNGGVPSSFPLGLMRVNSLTTLPDNADRFLITATGIPGGFNPINGQNLGGANATGNLQREVWHYAPAIYSAITALAAVRAITGNPTYPAGQIYSWGISPGAGSRPWARIQSSYWTGAAGWVTWKIELYQTLAFAGC